MSDIEDVKIKLAALWIFNAVAMSAYFIVGFMLPGIIEGVIAGELSGMLIDEASLLMIALLMIIPLTMAFLSLILKNSINRWANIILAIGWIIVGIMHNLSEGYTAIAHLLIDACMYIVAALIIWYALKWK